VKKEKFHIICQAPEKCSFFKIPGYIVAMAEVRGGTWCAFFDSRLHTEESIRKNKKTIKLHSVYPCW